jgi:excinuclease ABC subunit B
VENFPEYEEERAIRLDFFGDVIESVSVVDPLRGKTLSRLARTTIYPGSHYVATRDTMTRAISAIREELTPRLDFLRTQDKLLEAQRLEQRTLFDIEMMEEMGYCQGIENYSRHLTGRMPGEPPPTLMEYLPRDALVIIDESHATVPQINAMYRGDRSRKKTLIEFGFRLPSALDNRPLTFKEFEGFPNQRLYISATPAEYELQQSGEVVVEQIIRPTGLMDPEIVIRPVAGQIDDLFGEINRRAEQGDRVLVTTLTKRMAENLTEHYHDLGMKVAYLHSDINTLERVSIIRDLRMGKYDALIGINLLREGLDIPEVSLVAILDADKEGFLRSKRSLIQTSGRTARNIRGQVIMYADTITASIEACLQETQRRRRIQERFNEENNITPESVKKEMHDILSSVYEADYVTVSVEDKMAAYVSGDIPAMIKELEGKMKRAAKNLEFEKAAQIRDEIRELSRVETELGLWK